MGIKIASIDVVGSIINLEYKVGKLNKIVEWILNNKLSTIRAIPPEQIRTIEDAVIRDLQQRYPDAGISKTNEPGT